VRLDDYDVPNDLFVPVSIDPSLDEQSEVVDSMSVTDLAMTGISICYSCVIDQSGHKA
jgi:hypothetical protein